MIAARLWRRARLALADMARRRGRPAPVEDVEAELQSHLEYLVDDHVRSGLPDGEAHRLARLALGGLTQISESCREPGGIDRMADVIGDVRYTARWLRRTPMFAVAATTALALALGAGLAAFAIVDHTLLRALPLHAPERVVLIWPRDRESAAGEISYATFREWQETPGPFEHLAAIGSTTWPLILREGEGETLSTAAVSASFFPLLGTSAAVGRVFRPDEDRLGSPRVAVLSHATWVRRFGADRAIVGRTLRFDDARYTVIGVLPEGFDYPKGAELWVPLVPQLEDAGRTWKTDVLGDPGFGMLFVLGRLAPSVTVAAARDAVSARMAAAGGRGFRAGSEAVLTPLTEYLFGRARPALIALAVCGGLVLLIAAANVAILLVMRASSRPQDTAARIALGATPWRLVRQALVDASVLVTIASALGLVLADWGLALLVSMAPPGIPRLDLVRVDHRTVAFVVVMGIVMAILVGLPAGLHRAAPRSFADVSAGTRVTSARRVRRMMVGIQIALTMVLLVCAGLIGRSLVNVLRIDLGFRPAQVLTLNVEVPNIPNHRRTAFYTALLDGIRALPEVEGAGAVYQRPLEHAAIGLDGTVLIDGQRMDLEFRDWEQNPRVNLESVTPGYFAAIGMDVVDGRAFTDADTAQAPRVAIVSERLAQRFWPGVAPLGQRLHASGLLPDEQGRPLWATVVGVVRDGRYRGLTDVRFDLYLSYLQSPDLPVKHLMVRTAIDPVTLAQPIRAMAQRLEPGAVVEQVTLLQRLVDQATAPWRFSGATLGALSLLAVALSVFGVSTVVSQSVVERTREIGIRIALGARPAQLARLVMREEVATIVTGIATGLLSAALGGHALTGLLFNVAPVDPLTLLGMTLLFVGISIAAMARPTWRAATINPAEVLRQ